jgi:hypothetical protein
MKNSDNNEKNDKIWGRVARRQAGLNSLNIVCILVLEQPPNSES